MIRVRSIGSRTKLPIVVLLFTLSTFGCDGAGSDDEAELQGYSATAHVADRVVLQDTAPSEMEIASVIAHVAPNRAQDVMTNGELAAVVSATATCLNMDARVLASLVRKESAFNTNAVSPTGAMGLTQFTEVAVKEVRDQLGFGAAGSARPATVAYFRDKTRGCIAGLLGMPAWADFWSQSPDMDAGAVKIGLMDQPTIAIAYGGILLKTYLAVELQANSSDATEVYRRALMRYNGDPAEKEAYAKKILEWAGGW